ncbi:MAG: MerR family transcriptional regulator [Ilumatobacteraceae bacterium]
MTSGVNERPYLSIGEVLGLLLEEFPDVTISKIRFLESQGLIEPERTSSGYRKFFDADIERLRVILREQRENFLPLRVIRDRLDSGEIDDSGAIPMPVVPTDAPSSPAQPQPTDNVSPLNRGIRNVRIAPSVATSAMSADGDDPTGTISVHADSVITDRHPAAQSRQRSPVMLASVVERAEVYDANELCAAAGITAEQLADLRSFSLVAPRGTGLNATYTDGDVAIAKAASGFLARGIDARHLRSWRQSAEREATLYEQRILPLLRQRNPQARQDAVTLLGELADLGAELRQALMVSLLRQHIDP